MKTKKRIQAKAMRTSLPKSVIKKIVKDTFAKYGEALRRLSNE